MFEAQFRFPVTCPECGTEVLSTLPITAVRTHSSGSLILHSPCHAVEWAATPREIEQIQAYLDVATSTAG